MDSIVPEAEPSAKIDAEPVTEQSVAEVAVEAAQVEPATGEAGPVEATPVEATPVDAAPVEATPEEAAAAVEAPQSKGPAGLLIRLRPTGPWRIGPDSGARDRVDRIYHSDAVYAAVSSAMSRLGMLEEWLAATATSDECAVRFSSCFPFLNEILFVVPPRGVWPPPPSAKVRWKGARFVPVSLIESLLSNQPIDEERWNVDGPSECLLPQSKPAGPFRIGLRSNAAVDRLQEGQVSTHSTACIEYAPGAGLWLLVIFSSPEAKAKWATPIRSAFRLLADSGFGGERSRGWGRSEMPQFTEGTVPDLIVKPPVVTGAPGYWMLSLFNPAKSDTVDWQRGNYSVLTRGGRVESSAGWGAEKKLTHMVEEGSVLVAGSTPLGGAPNVAPDEFSHPVYRSGFAVTIPIPWRFA